ncbi:MULTISPECIES: methyltransferase domain-containing protein [Mesorhizobium]|uniref:Methyltransferase domain-containing protein n=4 Tax=Mesorhizobium TaxID=68287 RepID=Q8KGQ2_RHILI|nr:MULTISPECIES: methyltransferase domain-containing protein [Mesorhizobium]MBZ9910436.1 methyltransferase domain-containing protein [Mesorhizobium sp. BR115XR7A]QGX80628.1 methyltransferase domain-containing protein [Mesorhizobium japonicum R7A]QJF04775.1 methyltransferase domain-containing protein [Mesorhizobium japonicum R7A]QJF10844.1 methyltransferase domain-containing protein [Mesorhizobium japonicum]QJI86717.1 methyltransferase domain-containing protein [Mesorhizobium japonicum]
MTEIDRIKTRLKLSQQRTFPLRMQEFGLDLAVHEGVYPPQDFHSWRWYTDNFPPVEGKSILEIGCGFGLPGLYLAKLGAASLVACDIDPKAVANALENAARNGIKNVEVIESDIFTNVPPHRKFDFIFWNYPSVFAPDDYQYEDNIERGAIDPGYGLLCRYLSEGPKFLTEAGSILLGFPGGARDDLLSEIIGANDLTAEFLGAGNHPRVSQINRMFSLRKRGLSV